MLDMALPQPLPCSRHPKLVPLGATPQQASLLHHSLPTPTHLLDSTPLGTLGRVPCCWLAVVDSAWCSCIICRSLAGLLELCPSGGSRGGCPPAHPPPRERLLQPGAATYLWSSACPWSPVLWEARRGSGSQALAQGLPKRLRERGLLPLPRAAQRAGQPPRVCGLSSGGCGGSGGWRGPASGHRCTRPSLLPLSPTEDTSRLSLKASTTSLACLRARCFLSCSCSHSLGDSLYRKSL